MQVLKLVAYTFFIIQAFFRPFEGVLAITGIFAIIALIEIWYWDDELEKSLRIEMLAREDEIASPYSGTNIILFPKKFSGRGEVQNVSALRERTESVMEDESFEATNKSLKESCQKGAMHLKNILTNDPTFEQAHFGKWIEINIETGEYVMGDTKQKAVDEFARRFGEHAPCYQEQIGCPIYVGGSIGLLHSTQSTSGSHRIAGSR